ncbi:hypothetical protein [Amycolatopsis sp. H20-H5]|uniref:hypothetical protein n=1 Tax=Amycolatopsis sp. H20-H5 TaxID=3046309 RepID=UPI002DBAFF63|nr:hypothetical protein [Amycolatopsis sp. H20-H5]MEC3975329.1 hypothetical protein [Amycolatopsis sp. H20-H5]
MIDLPQPTGADLWPPAEPVTPPRLHKPWRALVALAEILVAALALWFAFRCWDAGVVSVVANLSDGTQLVSHRYFGNLIAAALGLGVVAAILLVDAVRQLLLAVRARHREPKA